jgi:hypothetical protein
MNKKEYKQIIYTRIRERRGRELVYETKKNNFFHFLAKKFNLFLFGDLENFFLVPFFQQSLNIIDIHIGRMQVGKFLL